jgi:c-di-GMP-binding flagellar brake protein YcgR
MSTQFNSQSGSKTENDTPVRAHHRASIRGHVMIHDDERLYIAPLENISAGGIFVNQLISLPTGRTVRVVVKSSKLRAPVQAVGRVVRVESDSRRGLAVEFTSLSSQAKDVIQSCVFEARMENALKVV